MPEVRHYSRAGVRPRERSRHPHITTHIVAERRHSAVTQYAERSAACRDSTRPCCRSAGGTPLLQSRSMTARADLIFDTHHRLAPVVAHLLRHHHTHRRGATALCHNPVRGAQRSVPGLDTPLLSACRRYATTPEPLPDRASGHAFS